LNHTGQIALFFVVWTAASPWILDGLLRFGYGCKPFSLSRLGKFSPEAVQRVRQTCRKRQLPIPELRWLPDDAPVIFAYGHLPKTVRIVVSRGLLDRLEDDEIAALVMGKVAHMAHGDLAVISGVSALLQIPYTLYWQSARLGDFLRRQQENDLARKPLWDFGRWRRCHLSLMGSSSCCDILL